MILDYWPMNEKANNSHIIWKERGRVKRWEYE
jgi:hypothetical protein